MYGCSKVFGYNMVKHYRIAYNLFAVNGILFLFAYLKISETVFAFLGKATASGGLEANHLSPE